MLLSISNQSEIDIILPRSISILLDIAKILSNDLIIIMHGTASMTDWV